jgi:hypothetical protein
LISSTAVIQLHNGVPVISLWPHPPPPTERKTYPSTPASIQFGHWELAPGQKLKKDTTEIEVMVYENACASGQAPDGRILEPFLVYDSSWVWIAFAIWSLPGAQTCENGPGVPYTVQLREPLGPRHLQDGARQTSYFAVAGR